MSPWGIFSWAQCCINIQASIKTLIHIKQKKRHNILHSNIIARYTYNNALRNFKKKSYKSHIALYT